MSVNNSNTKKISHATGCNRGVWESYKVSGNVDKFFRDYTEYETLEQFYRCISQDDKINAMKTEYRWTPYWIYKEPDEYSSCTRAVDKGANGGS